MEADLVVVLKFAIPACRLNISRLYHVDQNKSAWRAQTCSTRTKL